MQLTHSFRIPVPVDEAWSVLRDIRRVGPCMPGATIDEVNGDDFTGGVKVKVGPISMTYKGEASFVDVDEAAHRATIEAKGKETRGSGTARATVQAQLEPDGDETEVTLVTDLAVTGKPAQFGRGVMADVGNKLIGQFAECLSAELGSSAPVAEPAVATETGTEAGTAEPAAATSAPPRSATTAPPASERRTDEAIDLLDVAGAPILKRFGPALGGVAALFGLVLWLLGGRGRARRRANKAERRAAVIERKLDRAEQKAAVRGRRARAKLRGRRRR